MQTPQMKRSEHAQDAWLRASVGRALEQGCLVGATAERLGISAETVAEYYQKLMLERSQKAVHEEHGKVRVFKHEKLKVYFILKDDKLIDCDKFGDEKWKCAPLD